MIIACAFSILHMSYQVAFTAMFVRLLRAAGIAATASEQQDLQASFRHLSQTKLQWDNIIYRCSAIWGHSRYKGRIILVPLLLLLFTTVFGIVVSVLQSGEDGNLVVAILGAITTNIVLTGLTTGRIWWTRHHLHFRYNTAIAMLLESSALYLVLILTILFTETLGGAAALNLPLFRWFAGHQGNSWYNILPALVIVRVSFARSIDVDSTAGSLKLQSPV
ncbi:hypothetical protein K438DRAFT_1884941 [Mycena galopus ATCC 62051]|nr:hypothetical protein K438DRAFT_1884941 [Mycena galopus ATCC 62051]